MSIRSRHTLVLSVCLALSAVAGSASAQTLGYNVRTGDVWVDARLGEINDYGTRYREPFVDELSRNYGAPRSLLVNLLTVRRWAPADVYYACAIARALNRPCAEIVREYDRNPGQGWGAMAQRMGIKPGSRAFHQLKRGTVATYDRWGYPVVLDRNVRVDWSKHGPGHGKKAAPHAHAPAKGPRAAHAVGKAKKAPAASPAKAKGKPSAAAPRAGKAQGSGKGGNKGNGNGNGKGNGKGG